MCFTANPEKSGILTKKYKKWRFQASTCSFLALFCQSSTQFFNTSVYQPLVSFSNIRHFSTITSTMVIKGTKVIAGIKRM